MNLTAKLQKLMGETPEQLDEAEVLMRGGGQASASMETYLNAGLDRLVDDLSASAAAKLGGEVLAGGVRAPASLLRFGEVTFTTKGDVEGDVTISVSLALKGPKPMLVMAEPEVPGRKEATYKKAWPVGTSFRKINAGLTAWLGRLK